MHASHLIREIDDEPYPLVRIVQEVKPTGDDSLEAVDERKVASHTRLYDDATRGRKLFAGFR